MYIMVKYYCSGLGKIAVIGMFVSPARPKKKITQLRMTRLQLKKPSNPLKNHHSLAIPLLECRLNALLRRSYSVTVISMQL